MDEPEGKNDDRKDNGMLRDNKLAEQRSMRKHQAQGHRMKNKSIKVIEQGAMVPQNVIIGKVQSLIRKVIIGFALLNDKSKQLSSLATSA